MRTLASILLLLAIASACQTENKTENKSTNDPTLNPTPESIESVPMDDISTYDLNPLKSCIRTATFKSPLLACLDDFETELEEADPLSVDSIFVQTVEKMFELSEQVYFDDDRDLIKDTWELKPELVTKYAGHGYAIDQEEGMYFITPDYKFLYKRFNEIVSPEMELYLKYRLKNPIKISYDAGLILEPMEFAQRLIDLELLLQNDNLVLRSVVKDELIWEAYYFFNGMDNTPIYNWDTYKPLPEYRKALEYLRGSGGKFTRKMAQYYYKYFLEYNWTYDPETFQKVLLEGEPEKWFNSFYPEK